MSQSSLIESVYLATVFWDPFSLSWTGITGGLPCLLDIYEGAGYPNSGPHPCTASTLPTEPAPQLFMCNF